MDDDYYSSDDLLEEPEHLPLPWHFLENDDVARTLNPSEILLLPNNTAKIGLAYYPTPEYQSCFAQDLSHPVKYLIHCTWQIEPETETSRPRYAFKIAKMMSGPATDPDYIITPRQGIPRDISRILLVGAFRETTCPFYSLGPNLMKRIFHFLRLALEPRGKPAARDNHRHYLDPAEAVFQGEQVVDLNGHLHSFALYGLPTLWRFAGSSLVSLSPELVCIVPLSNSARDPDAGMVQLPLSARNALYAVAALHRDPARTNALLASYAQMLIMAAFESPRLRALPFLAAAICCNAARPQSSAFASLLLTYFSHLSALNRDREIIDMSEFFLRSVHPSYQAALEGSIGLAFIRVGEFENSESHLLRSVELEPRQRRRAALGKLIWLYSRSGEYHKLLKTVHEQIALVEEDRKATPSRELDVELLQYIITLANYTRELQQLDYAEKNLKAVEELLDSLGDLSMVQPVKLSVLACLFLAFPNYPHASERVEALLAIVGQKYEECKEPTRRILAYNFACCSSLKGDLDRCKNWLDAAISQGYSNWRHVLKDDDLMNLRRTEPAAFSAFISRMQRTVDLSLRS